MSRLGEKGIAERLRASDLAKVAGGVDGLGGMFEDAGIDATVSNTAGARDVLAIAKEVMGLVYLSVIDSVIYAEAIAAQADQIISADQYLRETVHGIKEDTSPEGKRTRLQERVAVLLLTDRESVTLPDATNVPGKPSKGH